MPQPAQAGPSSQSDKYRYIGKAVPRVEDARFLTGRGRYTDDHALEGQVHCAFLRSPHAHALIRGIDASAALAMPGVLAVLTGADWTADGLGLIEHAANPAAEWCRLDEFGLTDVSRSRQDGSGWSSRPNLRSSPCQ